MTCQQRAEYLAQTYSDAILRLSYTYLKIPVMPRIFARVCLSNF